MSLPAGTALTIETRWLPPFTVILSDQGPEPPSLIVRVLRPRVTVALAGSQVASVTPAGSPDPNVWPKTRLVLLVAGGLALLGLLRLVK